jgi:hypothetical protein
LWRRVSWWCRHRQEHWAHFRRRNQAHLHRANLKHKAGDIFSIEERELTNCTL